MQPKGFLYDEADAVGTITLNRPEKLNALTFDVYAELRDFFRQLAEREQVRAVVLTGSGRAFCSGGDVVDIIGPLLKTGKEKLHEFTTLTCDVIKNMRALPKPIVASVNGTACGAGAVLAAACDIRIASETAKIAFLFVKVGLSGADMGIAQILPRIVGQGRAAELLMTGDFIAAQEAYRIGLYNKVVPAAELGRETREMAKKLADGPSQGIAVTKRMLEEESNMGLEEALKAEARVQAECMVHPEYQEGFRAFQEKRAPKFHP